MTPVNGRLVVPEINPKRRTAKIVEAVRNELEHRRNSLDGDDAIRSITITVKMITGTDTPRAVILNVESEKKLDNSSRG